MIYNQLYHNWMICQSATNDESKLYNDCMKAGVHGFVIVGTFWYKNDIINLQIQIFLYPNTVIVLFNDASICSLTQSEVMRRQFNMTTIKLFCNLKEKSFSRKR